MNDFFKTFSSCGQFGYNAPSWLGPLVGAAVVWTLVWKALAMWRAGQKGSKVWFIVLLLVNTVGILDILYLYVFSKKQSAPTQQ